MKKDTCDEVQRLLREAFDDWERPCHECEHNKGGGCTKWECVVEKQRIDDVLRMATA
jgi:hypothetical protein